MTVEGKTKAVAYPTKAFFVRMITRDISLEDCILDLIDNSVDGAWNLEGSRPMGLAEGADLSAYSIAIQASPERFVIRDNCGGMTLDNAVEHAFSFGRSSTAEHDDFSIGVYGIGMKRAVFKLGNDIRVRSTFVQEDGSRLPFAVPIDVAAWLGNDAPPWDFDIVDDEPLAENGVEIEVTKLTSGSANSFDSPAFLQNLRRTIARDYSLRRLARIEASALVTFQEVAGGSDIASAGVGHSHASRETVEEDDAQRPFQVVDRPADRRHLGVALCGCGCEATALCNGDQDPELLQIPSHGEAL